MGNEGDDNCCPARTLSTLGDLASEVRASDVSDVLSDIMSDAVSSSLKDIEFSTCPDVAGLFQLPED
jgi:hypothetical protein